MYIKIECNQLEACNDQRSMALYTEIVFFFGFRYSNTLDIASILTKFHVCKFTGGNRYIERDTFNAIF